MAVTDRQRLFVSYYLGVANHNATKAAEMAGYKFPGETGCRLLKKSQVSALIKERVEDAAMPAKEVLARLSGFAQGDMGEFFEQDENGVWKFNLTKAKRSRKTKVIKKIKVTKFSTEVELHSPLEALDKLAKYHGLYDKAKNTSDLEDPPAVDESGNQIDP